MVQTSLQHLSEAPKYPGMLYRANAVQYDGYNVISRMISGSAKQTIGTLTVGGTIGTETFDIDITLSNEAPAGAQTINFKYEAQSGDTETVVADALVALINANEAVNDVLVASADAGVITLTIRYFDTNPVDVVAGAATGLATITASPTVTDSTDAAAIPFGYVVGQYAAQGDNECAKVTTASGLRVLGIAIRDFEYEADYPYNPNTASSYTKGRVLISKREPIWVPVAGAVVRGTVPHFLNATGQLTTNGAGSSTALTGAIYETDAAAGGVALVTLNLA